MDMNAGRRAATGPAQLALREFVAARLDEEAKGVSAAAPNPDKIVDPPFVFNARPSEGSSSGITADPTQLSVVVTTPQRCFPLGCSASRHRFDGRIFRLKPPGNNAHHKLIRQPVRSGYEVKLTSVPKLVESLEMNLSTA